MRVTFSSSLIQTMSGKISKDSDAYFMTRNGKTYLCRRTKTKTQTKTTTTTTTGEEVKRRQEKFKEMIAMVQEIMATTELKKRYAEAYRKQKKYATLRGFIAHCVAKGGSVTTA